MENKCYKIHIDSFLRVSELENAGMIELPYSEDLDRAVLLINKICSDELARKRKAEKEDMVHRFYNSIIFHRFEPIICKQVIESFYDDVKEIYEKR